MRAISIRQPWAFAILHAGKRLENREWSSGCKYRGPILLHASSWWRERDVYDEFQTVATAARLNGVDLDAIPGAVSLRTLRSQTGGIVGRARVAGVVRDEESFRAYVKLGGDDAQRPWWFGGFALVLAEVEALPFAPWKGALGLFEVPEDYATRGAA